jgi:hypothetical protein
MNITNDTKGNFYLKWDGGDHGLYHEITDLSDPRSVMDYTMEECSDGRIKYHYGMRKTRRRYRTAEDREDNITREGGLMPHLYMKNTFIPFKLGVYHLGGKDCDGICARVYMSRRRWIVKWEPYISITI